MKYLLPILLLLIINSFLYCQKKWSLEDCIQYAKARNVDINKANLDVKTQELNNANSKLFFLPTINASLSPNYNIGYSINPLTYTYENVNSITGSLGLNAEIPLYQGNQSINNIKKTKSELQSSMELKRAAELDLKISIVTAYFQILMEKDVLKIMERKLMIAEKQRERSEQLIKIGKQSLSDKQELEIQVAKEKSNLVRQNSTIKLSYLKLKQTINGLELKDFEIEEINTITYMQVGGRSESSSVSKNLPHIRAKQFAVEAANHKLKMSKGSRLPSLSFSYSIGSNFINTARNTEIVQGESSELGYVDDISKTPVLSYPQAYQVLGGYTPILTQVNTNLQHRISLNLQIPIFDKFRKINQIKLDEIAIKNQELDLMRAKLKLDEDLNIMYINIENAKLQHDANKEIYKSTELVMESQRNKYDSGLISNFEYQNSVNNYFLSAFELSKSRLEVQFRNAILECFQNVSIEDGF